MTALDAWGETGTSMRARIPRGSLVRSAGLAGDLSVVRTGRDLFLKAIESARSSFLGVLEYWNSGRCSG
jgi:hypothetical protein